MAIVVDAIQQAVKLRFRISIAYPMSLSHLQWLNACATREETEKVRKGRGRGRESYTFIGFCSSMININ